MGTDEMTQVFAGIESLIKRQFAVLEQRLASMEMRLSALEAGFDMMVEDARVRNVLDASTPVPRLYRKGKELK